MWSFYPQYKLIHEHDRWSEPRLYFTHASLWGSEWPRLRIRVGPSFCSSRIIFPKRRPHLMVPECAKGKLKLTPWQFKQDRSTTTPEMLNLPRGPLSRAEQIDGMLLESGKVQMWPSSVCGNSVYIRACREFVLHNKQNKASNRPTQRTGGSLFLNGIPRNWMRIGGKVTERDEMYAHNDFLHKSS